MSGLKLFTNWAEAAEQQTEESPERLQEQASTT